MSKAVRWQVPFVSVSGTKYRVDIYDETGSWSGVTQLLPGDQPFVTDEDASDDYFAPVRSQSGTLQVCTYIEPQTTYPSGGTLSLNDILPASNIAHPVRLVSIAANNAETIEWQGFLSCEAYNQDYVGIPQNLSLSLISVLEAMDSVHITTTNFTGAEKGNLLLYKTLKQIETDCGLACFTDVAYSYASCRILGKYFDTDLFFDTKEQINGGTTNYILDGMSCKELLNRLCTFMGWVCREQGTTVYFQRIGEEVGMYKQTLYSLSQSWTQGRTRLDIITSSLSTDVVWMGTGHQKSVKQGAHIVEVVANVENFDADMDMPSFPNIDPTTSMTVEVHKSNNEQRFIENIIEQNTTSNNVIAFGGYYYSKCYRLDVGHELYEFLGSCTRSDFISKSFLRGRAFDVTGDPPADYRYSGAAFVRYAIKESQNETASKFESGLYCVFLPGISSNILSPIFTLKNPNPVSLYKGTLSVSASMEYLGICITRSWLDYRCLSSDISSGSMSITPTIRLKLRIGDKWWNGTEFTSTETAFDHVLEGGGISLDIPITDNIYGVMELSMMPVVSAGPMTSSNMSQLMEVIITDLSIKFNPYTNIYTSESSENHYLQILNTNFRDEITISTDLASNNNNIASPSLIMEDPTVSGDDRYMGLLPYNLTTSAQVTWIRPEVDLLNRLASYYGASRQTLELEVAHPKVNNTDALLPILKLNGIDEHRVYIPLSENRDWQTGVCKLTCFEVYLPPVTPPAPEPVEGSIDLATPTFTYYGFRLDIISGEIQDVEQNISGAKLYIKQIILEQAGAISLQSSAASSGIFIYYDLGDVADLMEALETNNTEWLNDDVVHLIGEASGASGTASYNLQAGNYMLLYQGSVTATFTPSN